MASNPNINPIHAQAEADLLQMMLDAADPETAEAAELRVYPWNPAASSAEAFFAALEQECESVGWSTAELADSAQQFSDCLEQRWAEIAPQKLAIALPTDFMQRFQVPQSVLDRVAAQAQQVVSAKTSLENKLIQCVRDVFPNFAEDDWQVMARPYAYAMRSPAKETIEIALRTVRCAAWTELSGVEQARLSLAIARYAIAQMPSAPSTR